MTRQTNSGAAIDPSSPPLLEGRGLVVEFPGVKALDAVDFDLRPGEVHALMGENGAGKSTLIKVLTGLYQPQSGELRVQGKAVRPSSPRDAESVGVSTVYQEIDLVPTLSVAENICLGRQPTRFGFIRWGAVRRRAKEALARLDMAIDVDRLLREYPIAVQQMVAISRALDIDARVLILDEPTSSLDANETRELFRVITSLRSRGMGIVFVSHFLDQVYEVSDRVTVLRNGRNVGVWNASDLPRSQLIEAMTGRKIAQLAPVDRAVSASSSADRSVLEVASLGALRSIEPVTTRISAGEALGFAGLLGSGRTELARLIFGADHADSGSVTTPKGRVARGSVRDAVAHGIAMTPEDRKADGLVLDLSVRENIILALQARRGSLRPIPTSEQRRLADHYIQSLRIKTPAPETPVRSLSGGNQQKVLLARWMALSPSVLILDEPTRGIDVGAKAEIEALIRDLRATGMSIIFISSEIDELVRTCTRALVLRDRRSIGELSGSDVEESRILAMLAGATTGGSPE